MGTDGLHWEKVVRKLQAGLMPPAGMPRPEQATLDSFRNCLTSELDSAAAVHPEPGRPATIHRLNRAEYHNAIRDLLALDINVDDFLPADDAGYGFDNIGGVLRMSQALLERYLDAGRTISRLAVGNPPSTTFSETYRTEQDEQQHERATGMPFGTRGGMLVPYLFPLNADYDLRVQLGGTRGLRDEYQLEVTIDGEPLQEGDWIISYNDDVVVGAREWTGSMTDVPVMGYDGDEYSLGYIQQDECPEFKLYKSSTGQLIELYSNVSIYFLMF